MHETQLTLVSKGEGWAYEWYIYFDFQWRWVRRRINFVSLTLGVKCMIAFPDINTNLSTLNLRIRRADPTFFFCDFTAQRDKGLCIHVPVYLRKGRCFLRRCVAPFRFGRNGTLSLPRSSVPAEENKEPRRMIPLPRAPRLDSAVHASLPHVARRVQQSLTPRQQLTALSNHK